MGDIDNINSKPTLCLSDIKNLTGKQLQQWANSIGGKKRVSKLCGYTIRSFERMFNYDGFSEKEDLSGNIQIIPDTIKRIVRMSLELKLKGEEITRLKYENKILKSNMEREKRHKRQDNEMALDGMSKEDLSKLNLKILDN